MLNHYSYINTKIIHNDKLTIITGKEQKNIYSVISNNLAVCHSVCVQDYCKSNELLSLKLDVVIGPTNRKNQLTFLLVIRSKIRIIPLRSALLNTGFEIY